MLLFLDLGFHYLGVLTTTFAHTFHLTCFPHLRPSWRIWDYYPNHCHVSAYTLLFPTTLPTTTTYAVGILTCTVPWVYLRLECCSHATLHWDFGKAFLSLSIPLPFGTTSTTMPCLHTTQVFFTPATTHHFPFACLFLPCPHHFWRTSHLPTYAMGSTATLLNHTPTYHTRVYLIHCLLPATTTTCYTVLPHSSALHTLPTTTMPFLLPRAFSVPTWDYHHLPLYWVLHCCSAVPTPLLCRLLRPFFYVPPNYIFILHHSFLVIIHYYRDFFPCRSFSACMPAVPRTWIFASLHTSSFSHMHTSFGLLLIFCSYIHFCHPACIHYLLHLFWLLPPTCTFSFPACGTISHLCLGFHVHHYFLDSLFLIPTVLPPFWVPSLPFACLHLLHTLLPCRFYPATILYTYTITTILHTVLTPPVSFSTTIVTHRFCLFYMCISCCRSATATCCLLPLPVSSPPACTRSPPPPHHHATPATCHHAPPTRTTMHTCHRHLFTHVVLFFFLHCTISCRHTHCTHACTLPGQVNTAHCLGHCLFLHTHFCFAIVHTVFTPTCYYCIPPHLPASTTTHTHILHATPVYTHLCATCHLFYHFYHHHAIHFHLPATTHIFGTGQAHITFSSLSICLPINRGSTLLPFLLTPSNKNIYFLFSLKSFLYPVVVGGVAWRRHGAAAAQWREQCRRWAARMKAVAVAGMAWRGRLAAGDQTGDG